MTKLEDCGSNACKQNDLGKLSTQCYQHFNNKDICQEKATNIGSLIILINLEDFYLSSINCISLVPCNTATGHLDFISI